MQQANGVVYSAMGGCLIATVHGDLTVETAQAMAGGLLSELTRCACHTAIFDLSDIQVLDLADFEALRKLLDMLKLMGACPVLVGLRAGLAALLVELGAHTQGLLVCATVEQAMARYGAGA